MTHIEILPRNLPQFVDDLAKGVDAVFVSCLGEDFRTHGEEVVRRMQQVEPGKPIAFEGRSRPFSSVRSLRRTFRGRR